VCLSVTMITKKIVEGFVPNFKGRFPGERAGQVSLRSVEGCGVSQLKFNVPFQHKYGNIRDKRSGVESYPYPVKK